ncbi:MAG: hypothetical protein JEY94_19250 [Melioribacteraceae bacterium]|nr:hypothetical protein [Melioribacteraceae bacterium]
MAKVIIGIHGLANKPPKHLLQKWWKKAIVEGLTDRGNPRYRFKFVMVYWADLIYENPLDPEVKNKEDELYIEEPYISSANMPVENEKSKLGEIFDGIIKEVVLSDTISIKLTTVFDKLLEKFFNELHIYFSHLAETRKNKTIDVQKEARERLKNVIEKYKDHEILLIAHSMGTIITYDVLTHCLNGCFIDTLVTIGSPLGIPYIVHKLHGEKEIELSESKMKTPDNICTHWFNFADADDLVGMNINLSDYYTENDFSISADSKLVYNDYSVNGNKNPHKSYGYLRTPEVADIVYEFLTRDENKFTRYVKNSANKTFDIFVNRIAKKFKKKNK